MQPQYSNFNGSNSSGTINDRSPWYRLESRTRSWAGASMSDTLYVVKGGTIDKNDHILQYLTDKTYGTNRIPVPKYFFVALLSRKGSQYRAIGFWMEHLGSYADKKALAYYAKSIDDLERLTGIDFFCNLPDEIENEVEKGYVASEWGGLQ
jgi:endonuclease G